MRTETDLDLLLRKAVEIVKHMTPEQRAQMHEAQRQSFARSLLNPNRKPPKMVDGVLTFESREDAD